MGLVCTLQPYHTKSNQTRTPQVKAELASQFLGYMERGGGVEETRELGRRLLLWLYCRRQVLPRQRRLSRSQTYPNLNGASLCAYLECLFGINMWGPLIVCIERTVSATSSY